MNRSTYIRCMSICESLKHIGDKKPKLKIQRAWQYYKYLFICWLENKLIKAVLDEDCFIVGVRASESNGHREGNSKITITASLTTFPARINEVKYAIKSIMLQTCPPNRIVLWLAESQFPAMQVPDSLLPFVGHGLEVRFCEDLRSHKKYFYALQEQKENELVITFDDDIIYHPHTIERLLEENAKRQDCVVCSLAHEITFDASGQVASYHNWKTTGDNKNTPSRLYIPLTGSGCLYPFDALSKEAFDINKIKSLAFTADDLWIAVMIQYSNRMVCIPEKVSRVFTVVSDSQTVHLGQINCIGDGNNQVMKKLLCAYPEVFSKLQIYRNESSTN